MKPVWVLLRVKVKPIVFSLLAIGRDSFSGIWPKSNMAMAKSRKKKKKTSSCQDNRKKT